MKAFSHIYFFVCLMECWQFKNKKDEFIDLKNIFFLRLLCGFEMTVVKFLKILLCGFHATQFHSFNTLKPHEN
jgi:hypothetical protein